ncbi:glycosyltransferase family 2 protein [Bradyrhizobium liaoningense]|uniref:glycosyltransferase family 2 protein n=1 Tax=Bradyrhizobium liaoningense TaxID=43992 RepID=UPI001BAB32E5|nr:glycosyltransferase family A protein [Bradyrhizobium liaoningense]MBR0716268.1 glycosyltransferase family 2 protein [Bradyrhizobium liaoningense]
MPKSQPASGAEPPLFSIIIPLEYHRGQWEQSWQGWTQQTVERSLYEIILVVPPDFSPRESLAALAGNGARLEFAESVHDIGLCAIGAHKARGRYLFFTESHCWPEPDVLALCTRAIDNHPDWAGFSCRSVPICHNRLSEAEADMYQADIDYGMKVHPWRKVLDQCFVTRRDVYEECGGLREELGHFAEWVLAASYHARGHAIGYLEEARFHHYYIGRLGDLAMFTLDFVQGEIRYLSEGKRGPGSELLEIPREWSCQDNFDSGLARHLVGALVRDGVSRDLRESASLRQLRVLSRWVVLAALGDRPERGAARLAAFRACCVLTVLGLAGSRASISRWLKRYIAALIDYQRLDCIRRCRPVARRALMRSGERVLAQAGFHAWETWHGRGFRWSEPEAAVRISVEPGHTVVRIECLDVRGPLDGIGVRFYCDGARVPDTSIVVRGDGFDVSVDRPSGDAFVLAWICARFAAVGDERRLGLPVAAIDLTSDERSDTPPVRVKAG